MKTNYQSRSLIALAAALLFAGAALAQQAPTPPTTPTTTTKPVPRGAVTTTEEDTSNIVTLTPFEVSSVADTGYGAATTLAGNRLNSELRDLGNAVSVVTSQFLKDVGATDNLTLLQYTTGTEIGNLQGNFAGVGDGSQLNESGRFANPNQNTRVRGLTTADNTRDYFLTDVPWEGYAVDRVDLQRGPNSILFGQGSPAGIINTSTKQAQFRDSSEVEMRVSSFDSYRGSIDLNRVLRKNELSFRLAGLYNDEHFQQEPAFNFDRRLFLATRYEPLLLKRGSAKTVIKANVEWGDIQSNRPRSLPPIDLITPWFRSGTYTGRFADNTPRTFNYLNRATFNPFQLQDDNTGRPNHGQTRPSINGGANSGQPNPAYNPYVANFAQTFGGVLAYFGTPAGAPAYWLVENRTTRGIGPNGAVDGNVGGFAFHRLGALSTQAVFARNARLPFAEFGVYKNNNLTDDSVYNFNDQLIDGPNKSEWQNFRTYNVTLAQTFLRDKLGFEVTYNSEFYKNGRLSLLSDDRQAINIDFNSVFTDGTGRGLNGEPFQDGTVNPNLGRPFVSDSGQFGNESYLAERESGRATVFATHDFSRGGSDRRWVSRLLGRHTVTGLASQDRLKTDRRQWQRYAILDPAYRTFIGAPASIKFNDNLLAVNPVIYLGPSLLNSSSASGTNIPNISDTFTVSNGTVRAFDSTWANRPGVDPAAAWDNEYYPVGLGGRTSTQSENPANYVGWRNLPFAITDSEATPGGREQLTTSARLTKSRVRSKVAVWQGHFWDNAIVGTYGIRRDVAESWAFSRDVNGSGGFGQVDLGPTFRLPDNKDNRVDVRSNSWSVVGHLTQFIGDKLPVRVSVFYAKAENFQPAANRVDFYGEAISAPQGNTTEKGVLLETKDGRFSLRLNKYETTAKNASSNGLGGAWFLGTSQAWGGNWANIFQYNLGGGVLSTQGQGDPGRYTYGAAPGENAAQASAREDAAVAAWRSWQKQIDPRFYKAWGMQFDPNADPAGQVRDLGASTPNGFTLTEDTSSKGYEIEFNAQATSNWRLSLNASKTEARRANIGGAALADFVAKYEKALKTTPAGDLRVWWGGAGNETTLFQWNTNVGAEFTSRHLQEGTNVPELREWRVNLISNYDFKEGFLKGANVGIGYRWQDDVVIGYKPVPGATASDVSFDIANPYRGPAETNVDLWVGYGRRQVFRGIDWRIQLNVRNVLAKDGLIPITTQPDGTPAGYRLSPVQTWQITNVFKF